MTTTTRSKNKGTVWKKIVVVVFLSVLLVTIQQSLSISRGSSSRQQQDDMIAKKKQDEPSFHNNDKSEDFVEMHHNNKEELFHNDDDDKTVDFETDDNNEKKQNEFGAVEREKYNINDKIPPAGRTKQRTRFHHHSRQRPAWSHGTKMPENQTCLFEEEEDIEESWQRRAPAVVLIGAMKAGTEALSYYLRQHPQIPQVKHKEGRFFDLQFASRYHSEQGIFRIVTRNAYCHYMRDEMTSRQERVEFMQQENEILLDNSPRYLFWSDLVPNRLLCAAPWVKLIVLLRNPVDRAFSHYNMEQSYNRGKKTMEFEERIGLDWQRLQRLGLTQQQNNCTESTWKIYTRGNDEESSSLYYYPHAVLGRGLYALQLQHWFQAMDRIGKPRSDMLILQSEQLLSNTFRVVNRVLNFLGLPYYSNNNTVFLEPQHLGKYYKSTLNSTTRKQLEDFFEPYNQQLYGMLGPEWDGVWDP